MTVLMALCSNFGEGHRSASRAPLMDRDIDCDETSQELLIQPPPLRFSLLGVGECTLIAMKDPEKPS